MLGKPVVSVELLAAVSALGEITCEIRVCNVDLFVFDCEMGAQNRLFWLMEAAFVAYEVSVWVVVSTVCFAKLYWVLGMVLRPAIWSL